MLRGLALGLVGLVVAVSLAAGAEFNATITPTPASTAGANVSGAIAATNVFQKVFGVTCGTISGLQVPCRKGCTIQNNGTHVMYVEEGASIATATLANSVQIQAGQAFYCNAGTVSLFGEVDITGTTGDTFYAAQE